MNEWKRHEWEQSRDSRVPQKAFEGNFAKFSFSKIFEKKLAKFPKEDATQGMDN